MLKIVLEILTKKSHFKQKILKNIFISAQLWHLASLDKDKVSSGTE
jgi:hypothetical protein